MPWFFPTVRPTRRSSPRPRSRVESPQPDQPPPPTVVPDQPCKRIDFWLVQDQSRSEVLKRIVPYITGQISEEKELESMTEAQPWIEEFIRSEDPSHDQVDENDFEGFCETEAAFWKAPEAMVGELRDVARWWFSTLLRYTVRAKLKDGWKKHSPALDLDTLNYDDYTSPLDDKKTASLMRRPNLYDSYKDSYKETKNRPGWTHFCARMKAFTKIVGLPTPSGKLEQILVDLENDIPRLKTDRILRLNDSLILCRQLMENLLPELPAAKGNWRPRGQEYGKRWRELFQEQWKLCREKRPAGHPFLGLVDEEKRYYGVGEKLYGTLSERLHNHQEHRDKEVEVEVLRVVFCILPPVFSRPGTSGVERRWDLEVEKKRWGLT